MLLYSSLLFQISIRDVIPCVYKVMLIKWCHTYTVSHEFLYCNTCIAYKILSLCTHSHADGKVGLVSLSTESFWLWRKHKMACREIFFCLTHSVFISVQWASSLLSVRIVRCGMWTCELVEIRVSHCSRKSKRRALSEENCDFWPG